MTTTYAMPERQWEKPEKPPHPAPEVTSRPAEDDETCRPAATLRKLALANGWGVATIYARGTRPGRTLRVVDSLALRLRRDGVRMWAVWLDGKFDAAQIHRPGGLPISVPLGAIRNEIKGLLAAGEHNEEKEAANVR